MNKKRSIIFKVPDKCHTCSRFEQDVWLCIGDGKIGVQR